MDCNQLSQIFVLANEFKEGDLNVGGTRDEHVRRQARTALAALSLGDIARADFVEDQVTETLHRSLDPQLAGNLAHLTVAELKQILLSSQGAIWIERHRNGVSSEAVAAVVKIMTNEELGALSRKLFKGYGCDENYGDPPTANARIERIYSNARHALYSTLDEAVISDSSPRYFRVHTRSLDRDDYLAHPATGELIDDEDTARIQALYPVRRPQVQFVISDGLNANAINENLRSVLPRRFVGFIAAANLPNEQWKK